MTNLKCPHCQADISLRLVLEEAGPPPPTYATCDYALANTATRTTTSRSCGNRATWQYRTPLGIVMRACDTHTAPSNAMLKLAGHLDETYWEKIPTDEADDDV